MWPYYLLYKLCHICFMCSGFVCFVTMIHRCDCHLVATVGLILVCANLHVGSVWFGLLMF